MKYMFTSFNSINVINAIFVSVCCSIMKELQERLLGLVWKIAAFEIWYKLLFILIFCKAVPSIWNCKSHTLIFSSAKLLVFEALLAVLLTVVLEFVVLFAVDDTLSVNSFTCFVNESLSCSNCSTFRRKTDASLK